MPAARTDPNALWSQYEQLPPGAKLILRLKSLVRQQTSKQAFFDCLTRRGLKMPDGKGWSGATVNTALDDLVSCGMLTDQFVVHPALVHPVAADAAASADGVALIGAVRKAFSAQSSSRHYYYKPGLLADAFARMIHLAIYANDEADFNAQCASFNRDLAPYRAASRIADMFGHAPLTPEWFASRKPDIQAALLQSQLEAVRQTGVASPALPDLLAAYQAQRGLTAPVLLSIALHDLLAGRLDAVRTAVEDLKGAGWDIERQSLAAAAAFLAGQNDEALALYRDALKLLRKKLSKRKIFLDGEHGVFFLLALLRANDAGLHAEIEAGLDILEAGDPRDTLVFLPLRALLYLVQGQHEMAKGLITKLRVLKPGTPLALACIALAEHTIDQAASRKHESQLARAFAGLKEALPLVARIYAEILAAISHRPAPYRAFLDDDRQSVTIAFTGIVQARQPWEWVLESLSAALGANDAKRDAAPKSKRLAWYIDPDKLSIEVAEQTAKGKDGWSDGRQIALKRLRDRDPRLDYLTEQDRAVLPAITHIYGSWGEDYYAFDPIKALPALIGHPLVFDARRRSLKLELVPYPLELVIAERGDGYHVALSHSADKPSVFLEPETPSRYRVIVLPEKLLALQTMLGAHGLTVPASARDRLVALVQRDNPTLPIRDEIGAVTAAAQEGQSAPVVQLTPIGEGLKVALLVRVFGADGPAYVAGLGGRSVLATIHDEKLRATRDLEREVAERDALIAACPTLRDRGGADAHDLVIEDLDGSLELLLELQAYPGPVTVEWPAGKTLQVSPVTPEKMKLRVARDRDWFNVEGTVALDDDQVLEMRFLLDRLDRAQGRFVALGDGRFLALTRHLQAQMQRLAAVSEAGRSGRRVHALGAPALEAVLAEAGTVEMDTAWTNHIGRIGAAEGWTPKLPPTLQAELRDYQVDGFVWMSRLARWGAGACLADDMGLGKTVQAIAVLLDRAPGGPALVVAPTSVCPNWVAEITRFAPTLTPHRFAAASDRAALVAAMGPGDVLVCSYGLLHQAADLLGERQWETAVLDEAQAIKNAATKRAQASGGLQAGFRLALTGTPVENYLDELWSLFNFVNPGLLGSREGFQKRFAVPIERDRDINARQALRALIRPFLLRRTKAAVLSELPPKTEQTIQVEMGEAERAFYAALRQRALERIAALDGAPGQRKIHILAEITRLRRAACNPALIDEAAGVPSGKLDAFLELVDELIRNRHRALVFSQFTGHLGLVRDALDARGISYEYLDGSTPAAERERRVAAFQSGAAALFLISLRAGGMGLNLTAADYVVHLDPWWNPAVEDQASDRVHRIGQERPVTIYRLVMQDSIEERILQLHGDKRELASELLEGAEVTARLGEEELLDLIRG